MSRYTVFLSSDTPIPLGNVLGKGEISLLPLCSQCKPPSVLTSRRAALSICLGPSCPVLAPLSAGGGLHTEVALKKKLDCTGSREILFSVVI